MAIWWRLGGVSVMSWCNPRCVSVFIARVRLGGVWVGMYMRHVVFARYFIGVAVAFMRYFGWCMGGLLFVGVLLVLAWRFGCVSA